MAKAGDGTASGELPACVVGGHRGAVPSSRLLKLDQPGAGRRERLRRADPQTVAGHAFGDPGIGRARLDDRARPAILPLPLLAATAGGGRLNERALAFTAATVMATTRMRSALFRSIGLTQH